MGLGLGLALGLGLGLGIAQPNLLLHLCHVACVLHVLCRRRLDGGHLRLATRRLVLRAW